MQNLHWFDRVTAVFAPRWTFQRVAARIALRNYDAGSNAPRASGWSRTGGDANTAITRDGATVRQRARALLRNNAWARRALAVMVHDIVGWGAMPSPDAPESPQIEKLMAAWNAWSESTDCDADGRTNFAGLQQLTASEAFVAGEVIVRRRWRRLTDGYALPFQLQVLEAEHLDSSKNGTNPRIVRGVEFDARGRRVAYWLFDQHPGSGVAAGVASRRVRADDIIHNFRGERPGQVRGISEFVAIITTLQDLDTFEDGELVRQGTAASFAAFITNSEGDGTALTGTPTGLTIGGKVVNEIQPGAVMEVPPGKDVVFPSLPNTVSDEFPTRHLRRTAAGIGTTYEDLTGDYSRVNFSSARMARLSHQGVVADWQNTVMAPQFLATVWRWAMESAELAGLVPIGEAPKATWTHAPLPLIDPEKENKASVGAVRGGFSMPDEEVRARGHSPNSFWPRYAANFKRLDKLGIVLDSDPRKMSGAGQAQATDTQKPTDDTGGDEPGGGKVLDNEE